MHLSPFRPWRPLSDEEWRILAPFVLKDGPGRRPGDHRLRLDAVFFIATTGLPWSQLPPPYGEPGTVQRQFRRWAAAGLFDTLLHAAADPRAPEAAILRGMEYWLCCAYRRAIPVAGTFMARLLGYATALGSSGLGPGRSALLSGRNGKPLNSQGRGRGPVPSPGPEALRKRAWRMRRRLDALGAALAAPRRGADSRLTRPSPAAIRAPSHSGTREAPAGHHRPAAACTAPP